MLSPNERDAVRQLRNYKQEIQQLENNADNFIREMPHKDKAARLKRLAEFQHMMRAHLRGKGWTDEQIEEAENGKDRLQ